MEIHEVAENIKALLIVDGYDSYLTKDSIKIKYSYNEEVKYFIVPFDFLEIMMSSITEEELNGDTKPIYLKKIILHSYEKWSEEKNKRLEALKIIKEGRKQQLEEALKTIAEV